MDIVELSDSDEDNLPKCQALNDSDGNLSDFDSQFPSLDFKAINYVPTDKSKQSKASNSKDSSKSIDSQKYSSSNRVGSVKEKQSQAASKRKKSESDSDYESQYDYLAPDVNSKEVDEPVPLEDNHDDPEAKKGRGRGRKAAPRAKKVDEEKKRKQEEKQQERLRKKEEAARLKAEKQLHAKNRLVIKADYSMKMMEIIIDSEIENADFYTNFLRAVEETETKFQAQSQLIPKSITWNRTVEDHYINQQHEVCSKTRIVNEDHVIVIWDCEETIKHMSDNTFVSEISDLKTLVPGKNLFLVIYKAETYFKFMKNAKEKAFQEEIYNGLGEEKGKKKYKSKAEKTLASLPKVTRKKFEEFLLDIQLELNVTTRLIENPDEIALLIHQYTRSLAILPSKLEKRQDAAKVEWFVNSDSRDTVKVDKDGNGLKRLWQQQLCQFTLMSLESAEAITSIYKSPLQLMQAYGNCSPAEGEVLLRDVPIRRTAGPMTSVRRIGPELSKKLYVMFTSTEGSVYLNECA